MKFYKLNISNKASEEISPPISMGRQRGGKKTIKKYSTFLIIVFLFLTSFIQISIAQTITVKQDGTGDYSTIQEGINASTDGDTVLVWPGTYYENINYNGKNITLGSLNLTTANPVYISQTIIDGNQNGSCVLINSEETNTVIYGFTLQHGSGTYEFIPKCYGGGGVYVKNSILDIINCIVKNNNVTGGGAGINCTNSQVFLSGTTIKNNHAYYPGGGICNVTGGEIIFDTINLCNIYCNYAISGNDIFTNWQCLPQHIVVDTFTVLNPDNYYLSSIDEMGFQMNDITYEIQNAKIEAVNNDLFVSATGSDTNSGLTPDDPLRSVSFALTKIVSDSTHTNTINIANGVYSPSTTDEKFPLNLRSYISFQGENSDSTILDGDSTIYLLKGNNLISHFSFNDISIQNGNGITYTNSGIGLMRLYINDNITFNRVNFSRGVGDKRSSFSVKAHKLKFINCKIFDNYGGMPQISVGPRYIPYSPLYKDTVEFINTKYFENKSSPNPEYGSGQGIAVFGVNLYLDAITCNFINCEFTENHVTYNNGVGNITCLSVLQRGKANLINSTIGNNVCVDCSVGYAMGLHNTAELNIYNSIIYGNVKKQIGLFNQNYYPEDSCKLNIYNSLIEGGYEDIFSNSPQNIIYYDQSNIDANPLWDSTGTYPYSLTAGSPCINTGTLDLPEGIELPETDILGNPRIWDGFVDMGAYEYGSWVGVENQNSKFKIQNY